MKFDLNRPRELFAMDFAQGHYRVDGVNTTLAGMTKVNPILGAAAANDVVDGEGLCRHSTAGNNYTYRTVSDVALNLMKASANGVWIAIDYNVEVTGGGYAALEVNLADDNYTVGWMASIWVGTHVNPAVGQCNFVRLMRNGDWKTIDLPCVVGEGKVAFFLSSAMLGAVSSGEPGPWTTIDLAAGSLSSSTWFGLTVGARGNGDDAVSILRSIKCYEAGEVSELARLVA